MSIQYNDTVIIKSGFHKGRVGQVVSYDFITGYMVEFEPMDYEFFRFWKLKKVDFDFFNKVNKNV